MGSILPGSPLAASPSPEGGLASAAERPRLRDDLDCWTLFEGSLFRASLSHVIGSRQIDRYVALPQDKARIAMEVIPLMDGTRTFEEIAGRLRRQRGLNVDVRGLFAQLQSAGLAHGADVPTVGELEKLSVRVLTVPVSGLFSALQPAVRILFAFLVALAAILVGAGAWLAVTTPEHIFRWRELMSYRGSRLHLVGFGLFGLLMMLASGLHECAHGITALRFGLVPREMRLRLYLGFIPVIFLRIPGLYTVPVRQRVAVYAAGIVTNLALASLSLLAWMTGLWPSARLMMLKFFLANVLMATQNLIPVLPTDGYLMASSLLGKVNVRTAALREFLRWRSGESHTFRGWLAGYFVASVVALLALLAFSIYRGSPTRLVVTIAGVTVLALRAAGWDFGVKPAPGSKGEESRS
ncbi:MAG TPA: M50 family metallopeptidase [Vicinamibacteria bacterium]